MIHCLSNIERELEGETAREQASSHQQLFNPPMATLFPGLLDESLLIRQNYSAQAQQRHKPNSFPVNCSCIWCTASSAMGKSCPSTHYLEINHHTVPYSILCRHYLYEICFISNHRPCCHRHCRIIEVSNTKFLKYHFLQIKSFVQEAPEGLKSNLGMMFRALISTPLTHSVSFSVNSLQTSFLYSRTIISYLGEGGLL